MLPILYAPVTVNPYGMNSRNIITFVWADILPIAYYWDNHWSQHLQCIGPAQNLEPKGWGLGTNHTTTNWVRISLFPPALESTPSMKLTRAFHVEKVGFYSGQADVTIATALGEKHSQYP